MAELRYDFETIAALMKQVDTLRDRMDESVKGMYGNVAPLLDKFTGTARGAYDTFVTNFETEKTKLFQLLEESRQQAIKHVQKVSDTERNLAEAFGQSAGQVGG